MTTLSNPPDANAPTAPSLGADVEMLNNQLTASSNNHPPLTVVTAAAATAAASVDTGVAFAAAVAGTVDVDVIATVNNATVFPAPPSEFSIQVVAAATAEQFQVGMCYDSEDIIVKEVRAFAAKYYLRQAKDKGASCGAQGQLTRTPRRRPQEKSSSKKKRRHWLLIVHGLLSGLQVKRLR
jgi:hypothetical protein